MGGFGQVDSLETILKEIREGKAASVYLLHGSEEFLTEKAALRIVGALAGEGQEAAEVIRPAEEPVDWSSLVLRLRTGALFGGRMIYLVRNASIFSGRRAPEESLKSILERWRAEGEGGSAAIGLMNLLGGLGLDLEEISPERFRRTDEEAPVTGLGEGLTEEDVATLGRIHAYCAEKGLCPSKGEEEGGTLRQALEEGFGTGHVLVLTAGSVDRRKALYRTVRKIGRVLEFSLDRSHLQTAAYRVVQDRFRKSGKKVSQETVSRLLLKVGLDLRRLAGEAEKLIRYVGDRREITPGDLEAAVGRSREEQVFDLTDALGNGNSVKATESFRRLLVQGEPYMRILGSLRKQFERILVARDLLDGEFGDLWNRSMTYNAYQSTFFPAVMKAREAGEIRMGNVHPYALYKTLQQAGRFTSVGIQELLRRLLEVHRAVVSGAGSPPLLIEDLLQRTCRG